MPIKTLGRATYPPVNPRARLLFYGFGCTWEAFDEGGSLFEYAQPVPYHPNDSRPIRRTRTLHCVLQKLGTKLNHRIYFTIPYSSEYDLVIALYKNWRMPEEAIDDEDLEFDALEEIKNAVGDATQDPMWYFDAVQPYPKCDTTRVIWGY
jgi:hypothetical protein